MEKRKHTEEEKEETMRRFLLGEIILILVKLNSSELNDVKYGIKILHPDQNKTKV